MMISCSHPCELTALSTAGGAAAGASADIVGAANNNNKAKTAHPGLTRHAGYSII
jgi:hypothetical protein